MGRRKNNRFRLFEGRKTNDRHIRLTADKKFAYKNSFRKIDTQNNVIRTVERLFVSSSAWQDFGGYATRKMLIPSAKGALPIILHGTEKKAEAII